MAGVEHLDGHGTFWHETQRVMLWNRIEFLRGKRWAEIRIAAIGDTEARVIMVRDAIRVHLVGMIMDLLVECGGADIETTMTSPCPMHCENGYVRLDDGNYEPCPACNV